MEKVLDSWYFKKSSAEFELSFWNASYKLEQIGFQWHLEIWDTRSK